MDAEKWGGILDRVKEQFEILEHTKEPSPDQVGELETLVFISPMGKIKLELSIRPVVLDKKVIGAHRRGTSSGQFEYVYSETETSRKLAAFKEVDGGWQEIDSSMF